MSKRERQKARRAERIEREAQAAKKESTRQTAVKAGAGLLVVALVGGLVFTQIRSRQQEAEQAEEVASRLTELGCTEDTRMPDLGGGHIPPANLAAEAPDLIYTGDDAIPGQPPSSGRHLGQVVATGVYDVPVDPRLTTHNLEHGYIVAHYGPDAPADQVEELKAWAEDAIDGDFSKVVVTEYFQDLPNDANFSYTAWFQRQLCETFDADVADVFTRAHYDIDGEGPERGIPSHSVGATGVLDPEGEPLFLPPLDAEFGTGVDLEEVEDAGDATDGDPDTETDLEDAPEDEDADTEE